MANGPHCACSVPVLRSGLSALRWLPQLCVCTATPAVPLEFDLQRGPVFVARPAWPHARRLGLPLRVHGTAPGGLRVVYQAVARARLAHILMHRDLALAREPGDFLGFGSRAAVQHDE